MSSLPEIGSWGKRVALFGGAAAVVAGGAAVGFAVDRYAGGRSFRGGETEADEPLGQLRGRVVPVTTDDGVALHVEVEEAPDAGAVTVIFCHGLALDQGAWHYQRRDLDDLGRLVLWDQRGHGRSGRGDKAHTSIDQLGRDLLAVIEATAPHGPIVLIGHSMGGMTVMALADQQPELFGSRIVGVALVATSPGRLAEFSLGVPAAAGRALWRLAPTALSALHRRPQLVSRGRQLGSDVQYVLTKRYAFATDVPPSLVHFVGAMHEQTPLDVLAELFPAFDSHDKLDALDVLNGVETLILVGEGDLMTPASHSRAMLESVPGAELVVLPEAGHMLMLEHPDIVTDHLRALVERALRSGAAA